jgi:ribonuclease-3
LLGYFTYPFKLLVHPNKEFCAFIRRRLKIVPNHIRLYELAFLHRSASISLPDGSLVNNERLEFLGDAVLDSVIAGHLFRKFPGEQEGFLTQMRSKIVKRSHLGRVAEDMGLMNYIVTQQSIDNYGKHLGGDTLEALIGAHYLDKGYRSTERYILKHILRKYVDLNNLLATETDFKSRMIEWGQKHRLHISFEHKEPSGKERNQHLCVIQVGDVEIGRGKGISKKEAEQKASEDALNNIPEIPDFAPEALEHYVERFNS